MMRRVRRFGFIFLLLSVFVSPILSQTGQKNFGGSVSDTSGAVLAGAKVSVSNLATGEQLTAQTDAAGNFHFENLPAGSYRVTVESAGFSSASREISLGETTQNLDIKLSVGNISENVTVTATRTQVATTDTAVPVTVLTRENIEEKNVNTIGDIFRTLPGTSVVNEGSFQVRPRIRGLDSNRILILVDGERLNNARTSTGNSGVETGLVEIGQIETVEVVRGAGSVLYGTDALAGTVNIITKDAPRRGAEDFRLGASFNGYFSSNEKGRRGSLGLTGSGKFFSFRVAQSLERYDNYFAGRTTGLGLTPIDGFPTPGEVGNSQSHGSSTQVTTRFFFNDDNDLRLNYERRRAANIGSPLLTLDFGFNAWFPFSNRDKFSGRYETRNVNKYLAKVAGTFYWQNQSRNFTNQTIFLPFVNSISETTTDTTSAGFDIQTNWLLGSRNFLTAGISYFRDENKDFRLTTNRLSGAENRTKSVPDADFGSFAGFLQDEFEVTDRLRFIGGIRVERFFSGSTRTEGFAFPAGIRQFQLQDLGVLGLDTGLEVRETAVTGDFGAVFKITNAVSLTGRVGRSFRVANLFERFFTGAGSVGGFLVGNPNLKPESGVNFDAGLKIRTSKFAGSFTYFNNYYRDFLSSQFAFDSRSCPVLLLTATTVLDANGCQPLGGSFTRVQQTVNFGRVRLQGFEADLEVPFRFAGGFITPGGNISYLRGDNLDTNEPFNITPPLKTVLNLRYNDLKNRYYGEWTTRVVNRQGRLTAAFLASNGGAEPGFVASDIRGGYNFRREDYRWSVNVGLQNIFDRYYREQFTLAPARGRSFVVGTTIEFNKLFSK
jgi:hemoglobin/transferrin/lactoferrin receptor protein